ncbi:MAG TPA: efflux RND transporter permease subunit [Bacteroidales bacterium]|nr:efflux RND transporter permease subunit [Bacteroidales bacterium]
MKITEISIKRTTIPVVIFTLLALTGIFSYTLLNKELSPAMDLPINVVMTIYPGAAPSEVENSVTKPIEEAISSLEGIDKITAYSAEGISALMIQYKDGIDADLSLQEAERKVNMIKDSQLPSNCNDPQFIKYDMNMFPVMSIAVNANLPETEFYDIVDKEIKTRLSQIKGAAQVEILGGNEREIEIKANAQKLEQYGISLLQVKQAIQAANVDFPTGKVKDDDSKYIVRLAGKFENLDQIRNLIIGTTRDGSDIKVSDVASVVDGTRQSTKLARINGQPAIGLSIQKQTDGNAVEISKAVKSVLADFEKEYAAQNLKFTISSDVSDFTEDAVNGVMVDLVFAIILVSITMLLFLHTFRNLIFVFVSIPTSIISTFTFFWLFGFSLNLLTLLAMSIVVGVIVDDAIVVLENIHRHLEMGKTRWQATIDATNEIGITVASITIVLVTVFLPIGLIPGTTGQVLRSFSLVIVIAILISLLVSFTLVPLLTSRFDKLKKLDREKPFDRFLLTFESMINWSKSAVLHLTRLALRHKLVTITTAIALLIGSILLVSGGFIQTDFMDAGDRGEFIVAMELDRTAPLEQTSGMCLNIEKMMLTYPEITTVYTKVGTKGGTMTFLETPYAAEFNVKLVPKNQRKLSSKLFSKKLQNDLSAAFAGPKFKVSEVSMLGTTSSPLRIYVQSNDFEKAKKYSQFVVDELRDIEGTVDIESTIEAGNKEIVVKFDREKLAKMGLTIGEIGSQMYILYEGNRDLKYRDGSNEYDIYISLDEFDRKSKNDVENISFINHSGQLVKLSQVAEIVEGESPSTLIRYNKMPSVMITGNMVGKTIGTVGDEIKERIEKSDKPADVDVVYGGTMESQSDSFASLGLAFLASIILMYLTMVALYDSYVYPLVVMLSLPLSIIGALLALALSGKNLSIFSIMGIIMLMGLVAKNAILVVDFANNAQEKGKKAIDAIIEATSVRFRPILMTNLALIVGMLPIALGSGAGAEWKNGLGWVLIGGLISSMVLSFIIVPVLYIIFNKLVMKRKQVYIKDESVKKETLEVIPN